MGFIGSRKKARIIMIEVPTPRGWLELIGTTILAIALAIGFTLLVGYAQAYLSAHQLHLW